MTKHCFDFISYTLDLVAFSQRKIHLLRWKLVLDLLSICLIIAVQCKIYRVDEVDDGGAVDVISGTSQEE